MTVNNPVKRLAEAHPNTEIWWIHHLFIEVATRGADLLCPIFEGSKLILGT